MYSPKLDEALERLNYLKGPAPKRERADIRLSRIRNSDRHRKLIELRCSEPSEQTVKHLNLFCNRMLEAQDCCPEARQIIRRTYGTFSGYLEEKRKIETAVIGG
jgi:hypothetical protein